jgi:hypothetical protein
VAEVLGEPDRVTPDTKSMGTWSLETHRGNHAEVVEVFDAKWEDTWVTFERLHDEPEALSAN